MQGQVNERPLGELLSDLSRQFTTLVRQEVELAKTEMTAKATKAGKDVGFLVAGGAVAYAGGLVLLAAIVLLLVEIGIPGWLAAAIVGIVVAGIGVFLVMRGRDALQREDLTPRRTIQTLKEDAEWARDQTSSR